MPSPARAASRPVAPSGLERMGPTVIEAPAGSAIAPSTPQDIENQYWDPLIRREMSSPANGEANAITLMSNIDKGPVVALSPTIRAELDGSGYDAAKITGMVDAANQRNHFLESGYDTATSQEQDAARSAMEAVVRKNPMLRDQLEALDPADQPEALANLLRKPEYAVQLHDELRRIQTTLPDAARDYRTAAQRAASAERDYQGVSTELAKTKTQSQDVSNELLKYARPTIDASKKPVIVIQAGGEHGTKMAELEGPRPDGTTLASDRQIVSDKTQFIDESQTKIRELETRINNALHGGMSTEAGQFDIEKKALEVSVAQAKADMAAPKRRVDEYDTLKAEENRLHGEKKRLSDEEARLTQVQTTKQNELQSAMSQQHLTEQNLDTLRANLDGVYSTAAAEYFKVQIQEYQAAKTRVIDMEIARTKDAAKLRLLEGMRTRWNNLNTDPIALGRLNDDFNALVQGGPENAAAALLAERNVGEIPELDANIDQARERFKAQNPGITGTDLDSKLAEIDRSERLRYVSKKCAEDPSFKTQMEEYTQQILNEKVFNGKMSAQDAAKLFKGMGTWPGGEKLKAAVKNLQDYRNYEKTLKAEGVIPESVWDWLARKSDKNAFKYLMLLLLGGVTLGAAPQLWRDIEDSRRTPSGVI